MKFFAIAALAAVAAAQYPVSDETCSVVTVTVTSTLSRTPLAPSSHAATGPAPYPTSAGLVKPSVPAGTGSPSKTPSVSVKPTGTGAPSAPPAQFTGAASNFKVGGALAAGAVAAMFL